MVCAHRRGRTILGVAAAAAALAACADEDWPTLAAPLPETPPPLLAPVREPPPAPRPETAPLAPAQAADFLAALPARISEIESRIVNQQVAFETARDRAGGGGEESVRTAHFEMSRLSRIETDLAVLVRAAEGAVAALDGAHRERAMALEARLERLAGDFAVYLAEQRRRLALAPPHRD